MNRKQRAVLAEIERDVLDDSKSLSGVLRKCVVLGGHSGSAQLREWATAELRGYDGTPPEDLPSYRTVPAPILLNAMIGPNRIKGKQVSPLQLPEFARDSIKEEVTFRNSIGEIEGFADQCRAKGDHAHIGIPRSVELAHAMDQQSGELFQNITEIYWSVSEAALRGILDQVRTTVTELVSELLAGMPDDQDTPTRDQVDHALGVVVHGDRARINVTAAQAAGNGTSSIGQQEKNEGRFWTRGRRIGAFIVGTFTIIGATAAVIALVT